MLRTARGPQIFLVEVTGTMVCMPVHHWAVVGFFRPLALLLFAAGAGLEQAGGFGLPSSDSIVSEGLEPTALTDGSRSSARALAGERYSPVSYNDQMRPGAEMGLWRLRWILS